MRDGGRRLITVVIAAGVRLFREGLEESLGRQRTISVVATAADVTSLDAAVAAHEPQVVLVDTALASATAAVLRLRRSHRGVKVVALGAFDKPEQVVAYAEAGVAGFITWDEALDELVRTIESAVRGDLHCAPHVAGALLRRVATIAAEGAAGRRAATRLTARELQILSLIDDGLSNKQIAWRLSIEVATVKNHVHNILEKLQVKTRLDAAAWARGALSGDR